MIGLFAYFGAIRSQNLDCVIVMFIVSSFHQMAYPYAVENEIAEIRISSTHECMNWSASSFDWNQVRAFFATAEQGSLSAAARALGSTQPTLGRQVAALEQDLGVVLFERIGRGLELTPTGQDLLRHVRAKGEAAARLSLSASAQTQTVEGVVSITASDALSAYILPPLMADLRAIAPCLTIDIIAANDIRDLQRREADIAIRHVRPDQPDLIARLVRKSAGYFYAASSYLQTHGRPSDPSDLPGHDVIGIRSIERFVVELRNFGVNLNASDFCLVTENGVVGWELVKQGLGIGVMVSEIAQLSPDIERVLTALPPIPVPVWLTTHREFHTSRRIRLVFDYLAEALARPQPVTSARNSSR